MEGGDLVLEGGLNHEELRDLSPLDIAGQAPDDGDGLDGQGEEEEEEGRELGAEEWKPSVGFSFRAKIIEILKNLHSPEVKIYSEASKEFIGLLRGDLGGGILRELIQLSPKCLELVEAWRIHQGKSGVAHILSLLSVVLEHLEGKSRHLGMRRSLDSFAHSIIEQKIDAIYDELKSQESRRQSAALNILASIVKRGIGLASEVAKTFDFKLPVLPNLSGIGKKGRRESIKGVKNHTRRAFVGFAMSFIEVGNPRLLRWILQQRDLYSGVLRGLATDDSETVVYVLAALRDKVLTDDSLIPAGLRSVLFGSATLEQLSYISGNPTAGIAADIAHEILLMVCTDPRNGLMPSSNLKGNEKRLFELMKKLKATEAAYHKQLLLAIVSKRPSLCSAYMNEFPYHLEPRSSSSWFAAISLAADVLSSVNWDAVVLSLASSSHDPLDVDDDNLRNILNSIVPHVCSRSVTNKGLLHPDDLVRHGSLRLTLESVRSLSSLIRAIDSMVSRMDVESKSDVSGEVIAQIHGLPGFGCSIEVDNYSVDGIHANKVGTKKLSFLKQYIQDDVRALLPDPQVLLKLLSSLSHKHPKHSGKSLKRCSTLPMVVAKKLKTDTSNEDVDIVICGIDAEPTDNIIEDQKEGKNVSKKQDLDLVNDHMAIFADLWDFNEEKLITYETKDTENIFHSKLLDVLAFYLRAMPISFDGSFDFFRIIPPDPLRLSTEQLQSLLSLLVEYIGQSAGSKEQGRLPELMYKHLQPLINILLFSQHKSIQDHAYILVRAAMISTGAFDQNFAEIDAWLFFLPGYKTKTYAIEFLGAELYHELSSVVVSFLCDAVSTVGNNLYKYLDHMHKLISKLDHFEDDSPGFSPLIFCILQKCLRLLDSDSGTFKLHERSIISLYVCNTLSLILQSQVDMNILPGLINLVLTEKFKDCLSEDEDSQVSLCEWRPLKNLLRFSRRIIDQQSCNLFHLSEIASEGHESSLSTVIDRVQEFVHKGHSIALAGVATAFAFSIICAPPEDLIENFPLLLTSASVHLRSHLPFLSLVLFLEPEYLAKTAKFWPDMFFNGLSLIKGEIANTISSDNEHVLCTINAKSSNHLVSKESAAAAFCQFLIDAPFYVIFSALLSFSQCIAHETRWMDVLRSVEILLRVKISEGSIRESFSFLRYVLFWSAQILSSYIAKPSDVLEELFQICCILVNYIFERILLLTAETKSTETSSAVKHVQDVVDIVFQHPVITSFLSCSMSYSEDHANGKVATVDMAFRTFSKEILHPVDHYILDFFCKLFDFLLKMGALAANTSINHDSFLESVFKAPKLLVRKIMSLFRGKFEECYERKNLIPLIPNYYLFRSLMRFISPFELLELAHWMLSKLESNVSGCSSALTSAAFIYLYISDAAFEMLYAYLQQPDLKSISYLFWDMKVRSFDAAVLQKVYYSILHFATCLNLEFADLCLLKIVERIHNQKIAGPRSILLPLYMLLSRMIISSPMNWLLHCFFHTSKVKAKTLQLLIEVSPMHMSLFGQIFLGILSKDLSILDALNANAAWPLRGKVMDDKYDHILSENDFVLLLPAALSYITSNLYQNKQNLRCYGRISEFYSRILLRGFSSWKNYVSESIFEEEYHEVAPASLEGFQSLFNHTLLGSSIIMLRYLFLLNRNSISKKQRLEIFESICPHSTDSTELLDCDLKKINALSYEETLKLTNEVSAKISFVKLLLSPPTSSSQIYGSEMEGGFSEMSLGKESKRLNHAKERFISILVSTLDQIVRNFPQKKNNVVFCTADHRNAIRFLEYSILMNIIQLSLEIQTYLTQAKSIPFLNLFIRSSLLHRFEDPVTLKAIRCILVVLSEGRFSAAKILELLLGHSQFLCTFICHDSVTCSSISTPGNLMQPLPSILKSLDASSIEGNMLQGRGHCDMDCKLNEKNYTVEKRKLEIIRLLRVLYYLKNRQSNDCLVVRVMESKELLFLLLSIYGATLSEMDLEILHLMNEIESSDGLEQDCIAEMDYLWGSSALKIQRELKLDSLASNNQNADNDTNERRKMLFRENIPVDSKFCVRTVLHFCYDRSSKVAPLSLGKLLQDKFLNVLEVDSPSTDMVQQYDPVFILRFSIHSLLMGYIDPVEFSRLGLLAITLVSISSADEELRKLGYESLGRFKKALETSRKSKEILQLQLLLTYLQNGISEAWQKIPTITAIFAAEASFTLLDPSQNQFFTISKFLMRSPSVNLVSVPLFHTLFGNSSIHFKADRLWILHLLYSGINLFDDAKIYKRNNILELLSSFYSSSISDPESKVLILQIIKKSVRLPLLAHHLLKECGLLSWLSSVLSFYSETIDGDKVNSLRIVELVLKVVNDVISSRPIMEWLQEFALEQLSEISSYLHVLFVRALKLLKENVALVNYMLRVMVSTLRLSQKRKIYQPHFTLSFDGIVMLYRAINGELSNTNFSLTMELGIDVILMSAPVPIISHLDKVNLSKVLIWAVSVSLQLFSNRRFLTNKLDPNLLISIEEQGEECRISKILRWVTASVIIGIISQSSLKTRTHALLSGPDIKSVQSLLEYVIIEDGEVVKSCDANETLAVKILYLQQLLGRNNECLPSVILSLCLLLLNTSSPRVRKFLDDNRGQIAFLCSKICCPAETNPAWRWSYYQPWRDLVSVHTEMEQMEEDQACRSLLIIFSNALGGELLDLPVLSYDDLERFGLFEWERDNLLHNK
ncbi:uncharacterized protein [Typha angustifolia]|uniref:uncharacterized protein n=1 Tax=Typha angustifolia TaxID=59011 RepID=UPI003C2E4788